MALGEYTSVRTQNEQVGAEVARSGGNWSANPEAEAAELASAGGARACRRGWPRRSPDDRARTRRGAAGARQEELGVSLEEQPSPWVAAGSSFACFAVGALVPLLPYLLGLAVLWPALVAGGVGLFAAGAWWRASPAAPGGPAACGS
jgi:VIT1/CCC1 family predicted Fe2+/Mn2+ transporter